MVTIDARGCQVKIARQMVDQGGESVLRLKEHQPGVHRECDELCEWLRGPHPLAEAGVLGDNVPVAGGHGRIEPRKVCRTEALEGVGACERWPGLSTVVLVVSTRQVAAQERMERRYDISSLPGPTDEDAARLSGVIPLHWEIDNRGHGMLDVAMGEEANRTRAGDRAQNLAFICQLALHLWRRETSVPGGIAAQQKRAGWDHHYLLKILAQTRCDCPEIPPMSTNTPD